METLKVLNPYDLSLLKELPMTDEAGVEKALFEAHALFSDPVRRLSRPKRMEVLRKFGALMTERKDELALQAAQEGGKPLADSIIEVNRAINGVEVAISELYNLGGREVPLKQTPSGLNHIGFTMYEPAGPVLAISAFNHPVNLIIHQVIPAVAVGVPVIVKPALTTPLSCFSVVEMLYEAGLPKQWCTALVCPDELTAKMASDSRLALVSFIGSARVGWQLRSSLAPGVKCVLEHGGAAPVIVEPDADIEAILPGIVKGGYYHAGQVCVSVQKAYVHKSIMAEVSKKITEMVKTLKVGDPADAETEVGPLVRTSEVQRMAQWVKEAVDGGATLLAGGSTISETTFEPTLLLNPPESASVTCREIFGPILCLYEYSDLDDAIKRANTLPYTFQASIFTLNIDTALYAAKHLKGMAVLINQHTAFRVDWMPFAASEHSGQGTGGIGYSMRDMCREKFIIIKSKSV